LRLKILKKRASTQNLLSYKKVLCHKIFLFGGPAQSKFLATPVPQTSHSVQLLYTSLAQQTWYFVLADVWIKREILYFHHAWIEMMWYDIKITKILLMDFVLAPKGVDRKIFRKGGEGGGQRKNSKKYRKIALLSLFQGGGGGAALKRPKTALLNFYLLYLYRV